jgi:hypothetical protein
VVSEILGKRPRLELSIVGIEWTQAAGELTCCVKRLPPWPDGHVVFSLEPRLPECKHLEINGQAQLFSVPSQERQGRKGPQFKERHCPQWVKHQPGSLVRQGACASTGFSR